ncbi:hypothetical protein GMOD_00007155 [Pyrenophora seminiperda CCB06]|uniref:Uncharacterized protein n=1 Tax=Pyrenophora seminiperda CCB06 TaxID=1302712 RepID=A0A3M7MCF8_9PLEO|nr:hypothetical protein GMOD_00007155 [Pyrenophora seminiperda CCB06]
MAINNNPIKCKSCARVLATVVPTGLNPTTSPETSDGCDTCQQFSTLFNAVQTADMTWATYQDKRDSMTKSWAREKYKKAHMEFHNWLMTVEAPTEPKKQDHETNPNDPEVEQQNQSAKRRHSHSPTVQEFSEITKMADDVVQQHQNISLSLRPSPKRSRSMASLSMASLPGRKRLKFSETVNFPASYRSSEEYHRPSETYVRGRNAPPEGSEYMDTSGSGQTFLSFTQMKKVGTKWVELSEEELAKKKENAKVAAGQRKSWEAREAERAKAQETSGGVTEELGQGKQAMPNARTTRSTRRAQETSGDARVQETLTATTQAESRKPLRKAKEILLNGTLDKTQEPCRNVAPTSSTPIAETDGTHSTAREPLGAPEDIGGGVQRLEGQDAEKATTETRQDDRNRAREADIAHQERQKGTCSTSTVACGGGGDGGAAAIERDMLLAEPMGHAASCAGWEDAYTASAAATDDRPVAAPMLHIDDQTTSIVHDDAVITSDTVGNQDAIHTLQRNGCVPADCLSDTTAAS